MTEHPSTEQTPLIVPDLVAIQATAGPTKKDVIEFLAHTVASTGRADSSEGLAADALAREATAPTGIPGGIAIPHCRSSHVLTPSLGFARLSTPVDFGADDGQPADLVFLIAAPDGADDAHLKLLAKLARGLMNESFTSALRAATSGEEIARIVTEQIQPEAAAKKAALTAAEKYAAAKKAMMEEAKAETGAKGSSSQDKTTGRGARKGKKAAKDEASGKAPASQASGDADGQTVIVGVTSCPTGIAHTFMGAEALEQAGKDRGITVAVEGQGSGKIDYLDPALVERADAVIFAHDLPVKGIERFAGKPVIDVGVKAAVDDAGSLVDQALAAAKDPKAKRVQASTGGAEQAEEENVHWARRLQRAVMTGVSYMIPFVAAGGLLIALGFLFAGYKVANLYEKISISDYSLTNLPGKSFVYEITNSAGDVVGKETITVDRSGMLLYVGWALFLLGKAAMSFLIPALAGYISFGLAGRPGIAPGFAVGLVAGNVEAGFIGALIGGILAGYFASWLSGLNVPRWLRSLMPVVVIPLGTTLVIGSIMYMLLGQPLAALMEGLNNGLTSMSEGGTSIFLGIILGLMMCFDLGGPVNKAAYLFATAGLEAQTNASYEIMAATMAAGMVAPLALALATTVRPRLFTGAERENGRAAWLLGASFISEGAIPFAAADPLRIIPATMAGGAVTGALSMALHAGSQAPHGGIFVFFAMNNFLGFVIAILAGMAVTAALVVLLKSMKESKKEVQAVAA